MDKWHYYLNGKHDITVRSDHQPLDTIFKKPLNRTPPPRRFQRMMLKMQNYQFTVCYKKEKELFVADTLSRAATSVHTDTTPTATQECKVFHAELAQMDPGQIQ